MPKRLGNCALEEMSSKSRGALPYSTWINIISTSWKTCLPAKESDAVDGRDSFWLPKNQRGFCTPTARRTSPPFPNCGWAPTREGEEENEKRRRWFAIDRNQQRFTRDLSPEMPSYSLHHGAKVACRCQNVESAQEERVVGDCLGLRRMSVLLGFRVNQASLGMHIDCITLQFERQ